MLAAWANALDTLFGVLGTSQKTLYTPHVEVGIPQSQSLPSFRLAKALISTLVPHINDVDIIDNNIVQIRQLKSHQLFISKRKEHKLPS